MGENGKIAEHLPKIVKNEQEEKEHKRKEEALSRLYTTIMVARDDDLVKQIGRDIFFDLVDHDKVRTFRIQNQMPFKLFKEEVAIEFGVPVQFQRFWLWEKRENHTYRPSRPMSQVDETQLVGQLKVHNAKLKLFLEVVLEPGLHPVPPLGKTQDDILLFFKLYVPKKRELRYVGRLFVKCTGKPVEILKKLNEMAGIAPDEEIDLYEEIRFEPNVMCEPINKEFTFGASMLQNGDIICFQKTPLVESGEQVLCPDIPSFLDYVHNCQKRDFYGVGKHYLGLEYSEAAYKRAYIADQDADSIFADLDRLIYGASSQAVPTTDRPSTDSKMAKFSQEDIVKAKQVFENCLRLSFKLLFQPDQRGKFLEAIAVLSSSSEFSPDQISCLKKFESEFSSLTADFEASEKVLQEYITKMDSKATITETLMQYSSEYKSLKSREAVLQQELEEILSKKQKLVEETQTQKSSLVEYNAEVPLLEKRRKQAEYTSWNVDSSWETFKRHMI